MKWIAVGLAAVAMLCCLSEGQQQGGYPQSGQTQQKPRGGGGGGGGGGGTRNQNPTQNKQEVELPLNWKYPLDPTPEPQTVGTEEIRTPVVAVTVAVACENNNAHVEVKKDFFGTGYIIDAADIKLGTCDPVGEDTIAQVLIFDTQLERCDSSLLMTEEALIYTFNLNYEPKSGNTPVVRASTVAVTVECHYPRKHNVSSQALAPHWVPFSATKVVEELLFFTLKMMTVDWLYVRPINQYYLGDLINIQATVQQYFHVPLRVYVDSCVATVSPDANSQPRYAFIDNDGCMVDAALTGSSSSFKQRTTDNKLDFQLEAFRFQDVDTDTFYITCHLTATSAAHAIDSGNRACSYINGWKEASGPQNNDACHSCGQGTGGSLADTGISGGGGSPSGGGGGSLGGGGGFGGSLGGGGGAGFGGSLAGGGGGGGSPGAGGGGTGYQGTGGGFGGGQGYPGGFGSGPTSRFTGGGGGGSQPTGGFGSGSGGTAAGGLGRVQGSFQSQRSKQGQNLGRKRRDVKQLKQDPVVWHGFVGLGPIKIQEKQ